MLAALAGITYRAGAVMTNALVLPGKSASINIAAGGKPCHAIGSRLLDLDAPFSKVTFATFVSGIAGERTQAGHIEHDKLFDWQIEN